LIEGAGFTGFDGEAHGFKKEGWLKENR
jgi:hypothetical protein